MMEGYIGYSYLLDFLLGNLRGRNIQYECSILTAIDI